MTKNPNQVINGGIVRQRTGKKGKFSKMDMINSVKTNCPPLTQEEKKEII